MNYNLQLLIITHLLIVTTCNAMENNTIAKPKTLMELTCIKEPRNALYLAENSVLINGKSQCSIVDPNTDQEIKKIFNANGSYTCLAIHPNKQKFALFTYYPHKNQRITICNAITGIAEHTINWDDCFVNSLSFNPLDDTIAISEISTVDVKLYNYKTNKTTIINIAEAHAENLNREPVISFHPTQPLMCFAWKNIYIHNLETSVTTKHSKSSYYQHFCEYSPNESFIAIGNNTQINIIDLLHSSHTTVTSEQNANNYFNTIAIHPNSKVLITLSTPGGIVQYWNIQTCKLIAAMSSLSSSAEYYQLSSSLSFSPNGTKLLLVLYGKCAIFTVPFEVIYQSDTKQKLFYFLFFLKNHLHKHVVLPDDITQLLMHNLSEAFKR